MEWGLSFFTGFCGKRCRKKNKVAISINVKALIKQLDSFVPYLIISYIDNPNLKNLENIKVQDALHIYCLIDENCKNSLEIEEFYDWLGEDSKWVFKGIYAGFVTHRGFMSSYLSERKHYTLLYKLLMDLKKTKDENDKKA